MNLRKKTALAMGLMLALLMIVMYTVTRFNIINAFDNLQQQDVRKDIGRVTNALSADINILSSFCQMTADRETTKQLIDNYNNKISVSSHTSFINTNFDKKFNFACLINNRGDVVFKEAIDISSGRAVSFPQSIISMTEFGKAATEATAESGIIILPESPALYSICSVSEGNSGEVVGSLVIGRYLDSNYIQNMAATSNLYHLNIYKTNTALKEPDFKAIMPKLNSGDITPTQYYKNFIAVYTYVRDINNQPAIIIKVEKPDDIFQAGKTILTALHFFLLAVGIIFLVTMLMVLNKMVLSKLLRLKTEVNNITFEDSRSPRVSVAGKDEFASLASTINLMIDRTESSQFALKESETQLKTLYTEAQNLSLSLEEEINKRADFFRGLVHELKTPLTPIIASSESVVLAANDAVVEKLGRNILSGALRLNRRVDELLDISRGEMGILKITCQPVDIRKVIRDITNEMRPLTIANQQTLELDLPEFLPRIMGDESRLQQVVINLLDNAIKFTPGGRIIVTAYQSEETVVVEVSDNGRGINEAEIAKLFQPYNRIENERKYYSGLGLGLALCKKFIDLQGGRIWVASQKGKGSCFSFSLPAVKEGVSTGSNVSEQLENKE